MIFFKKQEKHHENTNTVDKLRGARICSLLRLLKPNEGIFQSSCVLDESNLIGTMNGLV